MKHCTLVPYWLSILFMFSCSELSEVFCRPSRAREVEVSLRKYRKREEVKGRLTEALHHRITPS